MKKFLILMFCLVMAFEAQAAEFNLFNFGNLDLEVENLLGYFSLEDESLDLDDIDLDLQHINFENFPPTTESTEGEPQPSYTAEERELIFEHFFNTGDVNLLGESHEPTEPLVFIFPTGISELVNAGIATLVQFNSIVEMLNLPFVADGNRRYLNGVSSLLMEYLLVYFDAVNVDTFRDTLVTQLCNGTLSISLIEDMIQEARELGAESFVDALIPIAKLEFKEMKISCQKSCGKRKQVPHTGHSPVQGKTKVTLLVSPMKRQSAIKITVGGKEVKPTSSTQTDHSSGLSVHGYVLDPNGSFSFDRDAEEVDALANDFILYHIHSIGFSNILNIPAMLKNLAKFIHIHEAKFVKLTHCIEGDTVCRHYAEYAAAILSKVLKGLIKNLKVQILGGYHVDHEWHMTSNPGHSWNVVTTETEHGIQYWFFDPLNHGLIEFQPSLLEQILQNSDSPSELWSAIENSVGQLEGVTNFFFGYAATTLEFILGNFTEHSLYHPNNRFFLDKVCEVVLTHRSSIPLTKKPKIIRKCISDCTWKHNEKKPPRDPETTT